MLLKLLGVATAPAKGYALVFWALSIIPITVLGFAAMSIEGLSIAQVKASRHRS